MTFLVNWRSALGRSILLRKLQRNSVNRQTLALDSIKNIGLVGSGTDTEYAQWTKMTKKVFGNEVNIKWLWQSSEKETALESGDDLIILDKKGYSFFFQPKPNVLKAFNDQKNELILCLDKEPSQVLINFLALSNAKYRVGYMGPHDYSFELMLDMSDKQTIAHFISEAHKYIKLMNPS